MMLNLDKPFLFVDAKSTTETLMNRLRLSGKQVQAYSSQERVNFTQDFAYAFSGSDAGIGISEKINKQTNHPLSALYNKVDQYLLLNKTATDLAFENAKIIDSQNDLKDFLTNSQHILVARPELSKTNGSALFNGQGAILSDNEIALLFANSKRVVVHPYVQGQSFFVNGVIVAGSLWLTDCWECFTLKQGSRRLLTSVVNMQYHDAIQYHARLQTLCAELSIKNGPIHFELVSTSNMIKIVKVLPRLASEPLPSLCQLLKIPGQINMMYAICMDTFVPFKFDMTNYFVADYSFIVREAGVLEKLNFWEQITTLDSYNGDYSVPTQGTFLAQTTCGATYGATILLKNKNKAQLLADIMQCQQYNAMNIFSLREPIN